MKKKIVCFVLSIAVFVSISSVAFAAMSNTASWSSSKCTKQFTTTNSISKASWGDWEWFHVGAGTISFPSSSYEKKLYATPKCGSTTVGYKVTVRTSKGADISVGGRSENPIKLLIQNPYSSSGVNMKSSGSWEGEYE